MDIDPSDFPEVSSGFHSRATPLHQAVSSGSLACVKLLIEAGAKLDVKDKVYNGTPLDWAVYLQSETANAVKKKDYALIENYLRSLY